MILNTRYEIKEKYEKKLAKFKQDMQAQMHQSALEMARKARLEAESAHDHTSMSAKELAELLGAIAIYARGGLKALSDSARGGARLLLEQLER